MATPAPAAPAKPKSSTFLLLMSFVVVAFLIFDPTMRTWMGNAVGFVFDPVLGFGGRYPLWTVTLAGVIMILASTVVRHFLVDWVKMARVQEVMRHFQKEFKDARKSNNTYKMKRLTDAQPELLQLQSEMSGEQLKPMALTMIVVIPIFLWLSTFMAAPVHYDVDYEGSGEGVVLAHGTYLWDAAPARDGASLALSENGDVHAFGAGGPLEGRFAFESVAGDEVVDVSGPALPPAPTFDLSAGKHTVQTWDWLETGDPEEPKRLDRALLVVVGADGRVLDTIVAGPGRADFTLDAPGTAHVYVVAAAGTDVRGNVVKVNVDGDTPSEKLFSPSDVSFLPEPAGVLTPKGIEVPWNRTWDLNVNWWILPHWILLYSMISIPLGTVTQKLLKKWEFSRMDVDGDGIPMGRKP